MTSFSSAVPVAALDGETGVKWLVQEQVAWAQEAAEMVWKKGRKGWILLV